MSIFPDIISNETTTRLSELPLFKEYAYDFKNNELLTRNGRHYFVEGNEAIKIWIYKAILTMRNKYVAYSSSFGSEIFSVIGTTLSSEAKKAEIKRFITEALMVNPYILAIKRINIFQEKSMLEIEVDIKTIYDEKVVNVECSIEIA